jgi:MFS family permease
VLQILRTARHLLVPLWGDSIGLGVADIGLVVGLSSGLDMLLFYPAGQLMDRRGRRAAGVPSLTLLSVGIALLPWADSFASLLAVGLVLGLGNGLSAGFVMTLGADLSPAAGRSRFLGLWRLLGDVGSAAGPMLVGAVAAAVSLPGAAAATAITGAAGALLLLTHRGETGGRSEE